MRDRCGLSLIAQRFGTDNYNVDGTIIPTAGDIAKGRCPAEIQTAVERDQTFADVNGNDDNCDPIPLSSSQSLVRNPLNDQPEAPTVPPGSSEDHFCTSE